MSSLDLTSVNICVVFLSLTAVVHSTYVLHPEIEGYVKLHKEVATWDEAKKHCENEGAILASPVNPQLLKYMKTVITTNNHTTPYFIGTKLKLGEETSYLSQEGVLLEDIPEALDLVEKLDSRNGDCLGMDGDSIRIVQCWSRLPYICYKHNLKEEDVTSTEPPTSSKAFRACNTGYTRLPEVGESFSYYKFYDRAANWEEANSTCVADGGHLAIMSTWAEARVVQYVAFNYANNYETVYIGLRDLTGKNEWVTVDGTPFEDIFNTFDPKKQSGNCVTLGYTGLLERHSCYESLPFVCVKKYLGSCFR